MSLSNLGESFNTKLEKVEVEPKEFILIVRKQKDNESSILLLKNGHVLQEGDFIFEVEALPLEDIDKTEITQIENNLIAEGDVLVLEKDKYKVTKVNNIQNFNSFLGV